MGVIKRSVKRSRSRVFWSFPSQGKKMKRNESHGPWRCYRDEKAKHWLARPPLLCSERQHSLTFWKWPDIRNELWGKCHGIEACFLPLVIALEHEHYLVLSACSNRVMPSDEDPFLLSVSQRTVACFLLGTVGSLIGYYSVFSPSEHCNITGRLTVDLLTKTSCNIYRVHDA